MSRLHLDRPICEPVELRPGAPVRAVRVRQGDEAFASEPFAHFHDVYELVLFGHINGHFDANDRRYPLRARSIAYIPSLVHHDFSFEGGARDWFLVQLDASAGEALAHAPGMQRLQHPFCARPDHVLHHRLMQLAQWLLELDAGDPLTFALVQVLMRAAATAATIEGEKLDVDSAGLQRLRPAIDRLRHDPANAPGAEQAARLCALSQAYFSRRFKQQIGMSWSDYVRMHRLHLASRRLLETTQSIAAIAEELGFSTPSHFGELFHRRFGMTPRDYRRAGQARDRRRTADGA